MKIYGELLIFLLLLLTNLRVFFPKKTRKDPIVSLGPAALFLSILQIFAWKVDLITAYAFVLSLILVLSNFHAIFRFFSRLYVDHYSNLMKFWAIITIILSIIGITFTILFAPTQVSNSKLGVTESEFKYQGSFKSGLTPLEPFNDNSASIYEFSMFPELKDRTNVVIFVPDKRADTYHYRPYLQLLSKAGFTICSADFYVDDCKWMHSLSDSKYLRRLGLLIQSILDNQNFSSKREFYTYNIKQELNALLPLLKEKYGPQCKYFIITDGMGKTAVSDFAESHPDEITGTFFIDSIPEYKTPGYGCIEQTEPYLAYLLKIHADRSLFTTRYMVLKSSQAIKECILKK